MCPLAGRDAAERDRAGRRQCAAGPVEADPRRARRAAHLRARLVDAVGQRDPALARLDQLELGAAADRVVPDEAAADEEEGAPWPERVAVAIADEHAQIAPGVVVGLARGQ